MPATGVCVGFGTSGTAVFDAGQPLKAASSFASSSDVLKSPEAAMMKPPGWKYFWWKSTRS
jgi:hypothetical protein